MLEPVAKEEFKKSIKDILNTAAYNALHETLPGNISKTEDDMDLGVTYNSDVSKMNDKVSKIFAEEFAKASDKIVNAIDAYIKNIQINISIAGPQTFTVAAAGPTGPVTGVATGALTGVLTFTNAGLS